MKQNENLGQLTNIMTKHDIDAQERIANLTMEISGIKERLSRLESAIGSWKVLYIILIYKIL